MICGTSPNVADLQHLDIELLCGFSLCNAFCPSTDISTVSLIVLPLSHALVAKVLYIGANSCQNRDGVPAITDHRTVQVNGLRSTLTLTSAPIVSYLELFSLAVKRLATAVVKTDRFTNLRLTRSSRGYLGDDPAPYIHLFLPSNDQYK